MAAKTPTDLGANRTGIGRSPDLGDEMIEGADTGAPGVGDYDLDISRLRASYIGTGELIGTMPPPASLKGAAKTAMKTLKGDNPTVLLDKLGERLAFERTGSRLYEAFIGKVRALTNGAAARELEQLAEFHADEVRHFEMVKAAIEKLGGDPTTQTPSADVAGVASMGLLQVITDPRSNIDQSLEALLIAELADNDGWQMLIDLTKALGHDKMAEQFTGALNDEDRHLEQVRGWISARMLGQAT